jgi:hypothetical protein
MERYLVFARSAYAEPLSLQGTLELPAGTQPQQPALDAYGADWLELILIPEREAFWAIEEPATASLEAQL